MKKLDRPQLVYSAFDRELFVAYAAVRHFRFQLEGRHFSVHTDHKPLAQCLVKPGEAWTPRQQRQLADIAEFTADICYVAGSDNIVTDALSRPLLALSSAGSRTVAGVKAPPGSPATLGLTDGNARASNTVAGH